MIEKNCENSNKSNSSELLEENDTDISNFKLLYRKTPSPERDKSSGVSSDEETTSSSLIPIPETLKQIRNKSKWTLNEAGEHYEPETTYGCGMNEKAAGNLMNSLEEIRKKYTLKNERSVALKMDSANMMLDDILNRTDSIHSSTESFHSNSFKEQEKRKNIPENESSLTESSASHPQHCTHIFNHNHVPIAVDFFTSQCQKHADAVQPLRISSSSIDKGDNMPKENLPLIQRKKSLVEKFQNLQIGCRIQSIYKLLQKTKNPFARNSKVPEKINAEQGIPGTGYQRNLLIENEVLAYNCEHNQCTLNHYPKVQKREILDLTEPGEISSQSKNSEKGNQQCTCMKLKECNCPEVIPRCVCLDTTSKAQNITVESTEQNLTHSESTEYNQMKQPLSPKQSRKEDESSLLPEKENKDRKRNSDSLNNNSKGWHKISSAKEVIQRTDIYYFDHGNSAYYKTTDNHPKRYTEGLVEATDKYATEFWAEVFGSIEIGVAFIISFILQLYRFLFTSIIRSLLVGLIQISSDYFFKPLLTILFNGIIQPCLILAYNMATSLRDLCLPLSQTCGFYAKELALILNSFRLIEINRDRQSSFYCRNKV